MKSTPNGISIIACRLSPRSPGFPPIGPMYLASSLKAVGIPVEIIDYQLLNPNIFDINSLIRTFRSAKFQLVGVSLFSNTLPLVLAAIEEMGRSSNSPMFVLGGPGVNAIEAELLDRCSNIVAIVRGEGESALISIIDSLTQGITPSGPGIFSRMATIPASRQKNLEKIPWPDWSMIDAKYYSRSPVLTARGCPFNCSFCDVIAMWGRSVSKRAIGDVLAEIDYVVRITGRRRIEFIDDTLTIDRARMIELCQGIEKLSDKVTWSCFARIDTVDDELLRIMYTTGCRNIFFGVDAGTEELRRKIQKPLDDNSIDAVLESAVNLTKLKTTISFVWGYPEETFDDFEKTIERLYAVVTNTGWNGRLIPQLHFLAPTVATPLYAKHGDKLKFNESVPSSFLGGQSLSSLKGMEGYERCVSFIRSDQKLFAPFHYYDSPNLREKWAILRAARLGLDNPGMSHAVLKERQTELARKAHQIRNLNRFTVSNSPSA